MAFENLPLNKIRAAEDQPRKTFYLESLEELAASIRERGVLEPIVVRPLKGHAGMYEIIMGERRYRASKIAGMETIPAVIKNLTDEEAAADALLENFQREDLNPIEKARAVQGLLQFMSYEKVCRTLGVSETTVRRSLDLLELPNAIQNELVARPASGGTSAASGTGAFGEGHARALLALNADPETQGLLLAKIKRERMSVASTEHLVDALQKYPEKKAVFLHVTTSVVDQMVKSLGAGDAKKRPYKAQTAREHIKAIDKQTGTINDLLDERVVEFLTLEEMNRLLANIAQTSHALEVFGHKVREALENKDYGFREVYTHCPLCGRIELVGSLRCSVCWSILRRCADCGHYQKNFERCGAMGGPLISLDDADAPTEKSRSFKCSEYQPKFKPQGMKLKMSEVGVGATRPIK